MYPPVVPVIAVGLERIFGTYGAVNALAFAAAAAPAAGTYVLLHAWGLGWRAVVLAGFLAASAGTGEAMAWGGYPQLIGLGILPLFILALDHFLVARNLRSAVPPALLLLAAMATSDLVGPITAMVGLLYLVLRYAVLFIGRQGNSLRNVLLGLVLSILLASAVAPVYLALAPGVASNGRANVSVQNDLTAFQAVIHDLPTFWIVALAAAVLAPLALLARRDNRLVLMSAATVATSIALTVAAGVGRPAYVLPLGIVVGLGAWWEVIERLPGWTRRSFNAAIITCLVIDVLVGTQSYAEQRSYYAVLNPGLVQALARLSAVSSPEQVVAVSPAQNDWPLGWWVEGASHRRSIYGSNPVFLNYADEKARAAEANAIFSPSNDFETTRRLARDAGATYLLVDKAWSGYSTWSSHGLRLDPAAIIFQNESVLIISTGA
jgi:hypothetical protein